MKLVLACALSSLLAIAHAAPAKLGLQFDKRDDLPLLKLPYATYRAASYDPNGDYYTFKNIRYAAPPVGDLRWAKPASPETETEIQDGSYGPICVQAPIKGPKLTGPGSNSPVGQAANQFLAGIPIPAFKTQDEDCLFLDLYVPANAIKDPSMKLPVISWFYGGAYIFGAKDQFGELLPLYQGTGLIQQSGGNVIFISSNYRMGAYGFLAGSTMERDGLPNAGFYDQRAVLQWIQDYIQLVGGDKTQVSAWGESAGAGSIMHHLTAFGGTQDPLFSKAMLQSPAFAIGYDRRGIVEDVFQNFTSLAGCAGQGVACLRAADATTLQNANMELNKEGPEGTFAVGPTADGNWVRQLAILEYETGNFWKNLDSIILSHTGDEAGLFVPLDINTNDGFDSFVDSIFPSYVANAGLTKLIETHYPPAGLGSPYLLVRDRLNAFLAESSFTCNIRTLSDAYDGKNYNLEYQVTPELHATDLIPTFYDINLDLSILGTQWDISLIPIFGSFAQAYQAYLLSHARTGDPNTYKKPLLNIPPAITWPKADNSGDAITNVLSANDLGFGVSTITDEETTKSRCGFWADFAAAVTNLGGYAAPGAVVQTSIANVTNDPSGNYRTPPASAKARLGRRTAEEWAGEWVRLARGAEGTGGV